MTDDDDDDALRNFDPTGQRPAPRAEPVGAPPRDSLSLIDLDAWAPPPPPAAGPLADAVLARMRAPLPSLVDEPIRRTSRRRWAIAAGAVAAAAVGVLAIARWGTDRAPPDGHGEVFAARASHLGLGSSSAELDPGAEVRWRREGGRLSASQARGGVLWRAGGDDTLVIDAGAAVASVEARRASLRVEVQMNLSDARVIGASAATAAVVALVTVVVYEGHVKVSSAGQTVVVEPGSTVEVRPPEAGRDALTVGAHTPQTPPQPPQPPQPPSPFMPVVADTLDRAAIAKGLQRVTPAVDACDDGSYRGTISARLQVAPDGTVADVQLQSSGTRVHACVERALGAARFDVTKHGGTLTWSFQFDADPPAPRPGPSCDADQPDRQGRDRFAAGQYAAALALFERSLACKPDPAVVLRATLAACHSSNTGRAARYYARLSARLKRQAAAACAPLGLTEADLAGGCDDDALAEKGREMHAIGNNAAAEAQFDRAYACRADPSYAEKAFVVACNIPSLAKARKHWARISPAMRRRALAICIRNGIMEDELDQAPAPGRLQVRSLPLATVFIDGKEAGRTPLDVDLPPGRHTVKLEAGGKSHVHAVEIKGGQTVTLDKDLTNP